jgi:ubiquinone/menaquinone biosynthesis C-methylase UbiE
MPTDKLSGLWPLRHRSYPHEILDEGDHPPEHLYGTFEDMRQVNAFLGGTRISLNGLTRLTGHLRPGDSFSIVDIGTGHADIPRAVMNWAADRELRCDAIGLDIDQATIDTARTLPPNRSITFMQGSMLDLPLDTDSVDIAMSSMTLHHLTDDDAVVALQEMARVSRLGIVVNDLSRTVHGYAVAWLLGRVATSNPLTRHDAHRSIQRGRTEPELAELARRAGLGPPVFDTTLWYRIAMTIGVRSW